MGTLEHRAILEGYKGTRTPLGDPHNSYNSNIDRLRLTDIKRLQFGNVGFCASYMCILFEITVAPC